mgnify:CR=1 FL=1
MKILNQILQLIGWVRPQTRPSWIWVHINLLTNEERRGKK